MDALDERQIDDHLGQVVKEAGRVDISFDAVGIGLVGGYGPAMATTRRLMTLDELAAVATFMASEKAGGMTGTKVNLTMGSLDD